LDAKQTADAALVVYAQKKVASVRRLHRLQRPHGGFERRGEVGGGPRLLRPVIIGSKFVCRIAWPTTIDGRPAIVVFVSRRVWITGVNRYMLHTADPWLRAIGLRTHGRVLGRQFERFARRARLD
jgi:hypothetical protein